ncbi:hypothetical protein ABTO49_21480, partial [Acinetobacter baumannii]
FQAAGPVERDSHWSCAALRPQSERKPDIAPKHLRKTAGLVSASEMNGSLAMDAGGWGTRLC